MNNSYGYIYKITNLINGKIYIGQRKIYDEFRDDLSLDKYMGSGVYINRSINKNGIENFSKEIIDFADSKEELNYKEKYWIKELGSLYKNGNGYNLTDGGMGGATYGERNAWSKEGRIRNNIKNHWIGRKHSEETKEKISKTKKGSTPPNKGKKYTEAEKEIYI